MKLNVSSSSALRLPADVAVVGIPEGASPRSGALGELAAALGPSFAKQLKKAEFTGKKDQSLDLQTHGALKPLRVLLVGTGKDTPTEVSVRSLAARGARFAVDAHAASLVLALPALSAEIARAAAEGVVLGAYRYNRYMTGDRLPKVELGSVTLAAGERVSKPLQEAAGLGQRIGEAVCIARDLINDPPNELYPESMAKFAVKLGREKGLKVSVLDMPALAKRGMNLFVAVGQGSVREPRLIHMTYTPKGPTTKRLVFIGKGLTFDTGGICIKPAGGMEEMKGDMGGAANVIALMSAIAEVAPQIEVHGIIGAAENMPGGNAYRPGDIFKSLDGKTVEIINTDAEGRLVLADVITYARGLNPDVMIDNATLTGACVVALGPTVSAFYSNDDQVADGFRAAARAAGEATWQMPLVEDLRDGLKSDWADLKHTADRWGGSITAALFLREFVGETPWIHVDIAGPSMASKSYGLYNKGGTGHLVLTFLRYVEDYARSQT